jgi:hypothetical protein
LEQHEVVEEPRKDASPAQSNWQVVRAANLRQ